MKSEIASRASQRVRNRDRILHRVCRNVFTRVLHDVSHRHGLNLNHHGAGRIGDGSGIQLRLRLADGSSGMVMLLASVVDNATNDTYTVMGSMMDGGIGVMP